jgi:hypothetical protein
MLFKSVVGHSIGKTTTCEHFSKLFSVESERLKFFDKTLKLGTDAQYKVRLAAIEAAEFILMEVQIAKSHFSEPNQDSLFEQKMLFEAAIFLLALTVEETGTKISTCS